MTVMLTKEQFELARNTVQYQSGYIGWKGIDLSYIATNDYTAQLLSYKNADDFVGATDYDMKIDLSDANREEWVSLSQQVISTKQDLKWFEFIPTKNDVQLIYGSNILISDIKQNPLGIIISGVSLTHIPLLNMGAIFNSKLHEKISKKEYFILQIAEQYRFYELGRCQSKALFHILNGRTIKEAAKMMNISPRTVETHLEQVKIKLNCKTKQQLFEKAHELGLFNIFIQ